MRTYTHICDTRFARVEGENRFLNVPLDFRSPGALLAVGRGLSTRDAATLLGTPCCVGDGKSF